MLLMIPSLVGHVSIRSPLETEYFLALDKGRGILQVIRRFEMKR